MILIDTALEKREAEGKPIRVGMIGAGFMAKGICTQIINYTKGMRLVAISNRNPQKAQEIYTLAGAEDVSTAHTQSELDAQIEQNKYVVTDDPELLAKSPHIDVILEVTGTLEYSVPVILEAIKHKKYILSMNAELDGTLGPLLKKKADEAGVIYTNTDGDQPGIEMNLYRYVKGIGLTPKLIGNIKGLQDPYRTPETQKSFAERWGQKPHMVTSFADGTKISFEQAIVANAVGFGVAKRGMWAPTVPVGTPLEEAVKAFDTHKVMNSNGLVDYLVGPNPNGGVFVLGTIDNPLQKHYLNLYKLGEGPLYCFYFHVHICHFEVPFSIARVALFGDRIVTPKDKPYVEVVTLAKKNLKTGEKIDYMGGFTTYGECENAQVARAQNLLPIGLAEGCVLKKDISKDAALTFDDVELPAGRLIDTLWQEQRRMFS